MSGQTCTGNAFRLNVDNGGIFQPPSADGTNEHVDGQPPRRARPDWLRDSEDFGEHGARKNQCETRESRG